MPMDKLLLEAALEGLTAQRDRIAGQIAQLQAMMGKRSPGRPKSWVSSGSPKEAATPKARKPRRKMSAEARERIAAAQRKRWAAARKAAK